MEGTVKFFNRLKGFGFIAGDDGNDYFVHFTALDQGTKLYQDDRVSFDPVEGDRGLKADNVKKIGSAQGGKETSAPAAEESAAESKAPAEESAPAEEPAAQEAPAEEEPTKEEPAAEPEAKAPAEEELTKEEPAAEPKAKAPAEEPAEEEKTE